MTMLFGVLLALLLQAADTFTLTVQGGTGSGTYVCGAQVAIEAPASMPTTYTVDGVTKKVKQNLVFDRWGGDPSSELLGRKSTLTMPCRDVSIHARYKAR